jgi:hypothetical protein
MMGITLPGVSGAEFTPEQYSGAVNSLVWTITCCIVLWKFSSACCAVLHAIGGAIMVVAGAVTNISQAVCGLLNTVNGVIPGLTNEAASAMRWIKYAQCVNAGASVLTSLIGIIRIPFTWGQAVRMAHEGFDRKKPQSWNRYGVVASCVLATLMFVFAPLFGTAKSYKCFEPLMRMLEKLPYVTFFIDWWQKYWAGETDLDSFPKTVRDLNGDEVPILPKGVFDYGYSNGEKREHDFGLCESDCEEGHCTAPNTCSCKCHVEEERLSHDEAVEDGEPFEAPTGLGFGDAKPRSEDDEHLIRKTKAAKINRENAQKSATEDEESRRERLRNSGDDLHMAYMSKRKPNLQPFVAATKDVLPPGLADVSEIQVEEEGERMENEGFPFDWDGVPLRGVWNLYGAYDRTKAELLKLATRDWFATVQAHVDAHWEKYLCGASFLLGFVGTIWWNQRKQEQDPKVWTDEGKKKTSRVRYFAPKSRVRSGGKSHWDHVESSGAEFEEPDDVEAADARAHAAHIADMRRGEEEHARQEQRDRMIAKEREYRARHGHSADRHLKGERGEGFRIDEKLDELKLKHFPVYTDPAKVRVRSNAIRRAKTKPKVVNRSEVDQFHKDAKVALADETLLGKSKLKYTDFAGKVMKMTYSGQCSSTATVVGDKVVVPLHSYVEGATPGVTNSATTVELRGEVYPVAEDLGVYLHRGTIKRAATWRMRPPKCEIVMQLGFTDPEQIEPAMGFGFCSAGGLYNAPTEFGDCGGPVIACADGCLVGFHIAGSSEVNRFIPMTAELADRLKSTETSLAALDFP